MKTKFGTAKLNTNGYYKITSAKEGNNNKYLHILIYENFWGVKLPTEIHVHHKDGNKLNNCILNLEALHNSEHRKLHPASEETRKKISESNKGRCVSEETRKKIGESNKGRFYTDEMCKSMSIPKNTSGYFRVSKQKDPKMKQGFRWRYCYVRKHKQKCIKSVDFDKLKEKVIEKGLPWFEIKNGGNNNEILN